MQVPKKISPDRIVDSIVEIKYNTKAPFEVVIGMIFNALDSSYLYTNRHLPKVNFGGNIPILNVPIFYNEFIKIELQPNSIIFNCIKNYIGWGNYKAEIEKALHQILTANSIIESFIRIGVRYVSEYENMSISDITKYSFTFGMPLVISKSYGFNTQFEYDGMNVVVNLKNNTPLLLPNHQQKVTTISNIDVDVIKQIDKITSVENLIPEIEKVKQNQKIVFFSMLSENFLKTLDPQY